MLIKFIGTVNFMDTPRTFKRYKNNTLVKSIIIPLIIIILSALMFYMALPYVEDTLPNENEYSEQIVQTEAVENE